MQVNVTALVESVDHVCCRYRVTNFRPLWEKAGVRLNVTPWPKRWRDWFGLKQALHSENVVIVQRKLPSWWQLRLLRRAAQFLVFDFDDAVFLRDSYASKGLQSSGRRRRFANMVQAADAVSAGNEFLADHAIQFGRGKPVQVIPTCVEPSRYSVPAENRNDSKKLELVWVGSSSTLNGLEQIRPLLEKIGRTLPNTRLKLICDRFLSLDHMEVVRCPWSEESEPREIASSDVGITWIPNDDWSRGKCGLKTLQYMAAGLPVVANPVGVHREMIAHGKTGFLAETDDDWVNAVAALGRDRQLRRTLGANGQAAATARYSCKVGAAKWLEILANAAQLVRRVG